MKISKRKLAYHNNPWWNDWYYCDVFGWNAYGGWFSFNIFHPIRTVQSILYRV